MEERTRISRRRLLRVSASAAAAVTLAACQPAAPPAPTKAPDKPAEAVTQAPVEAPTTVPAATGEKVSLTFLSPDMGGDQTAWFEEEFLPAFLAEFPNVEKVDFIASDYGKINESLLTAFAAGTPPDLFEHGSAASGAAWAASGQTLALDEFFAALPQEQKDDYYEPAIETCYFEGKLYSMPRTVAPQALAYRKDYFEEAGLDPEKGPDTWEDLLEMAKKLVKMEDGKMVRCGLRCPDKGWGLQQGWWPLLYQNGGSILNEDMTKAAFDSPAALEAMNWYHDLIWKEEVDILGGLPVGVSSNMVNTGQAAMAWMNGPGFIVEAKNNFPDVYENLGVFMPTQRVRRASMLACDRTFIALKSKVPAAAWDFLMFSHRPEQMTARYRASGGILPPLKSFQNGPEVTGEPLLVALLKAIEFGFQWPPTPKWNDFREKMTSMSDAFMAQPGPVDQIVIDTAKEVNTILAQS